MTGNRLSFLGAVGDAALRPALIVDGKEISFAALVGPVAHAMSRLREMGVDADEPVGLLAESQPGTLVWLYAAFELGVPVALIPPRLPRVEQRRFRRDVGAALVLKAADAPALSVATTVLPEVAPLPDDERPLAIVRTSGTSGQPKGVVLSRRAFAAAAAASAANLGWHDDDRWWLGLSPGHVGGLSIITRCLIARRPVTLRDMPRFEARAVLEMLRDDRVTLLSLVPTMLRRLLELEDVPPPALRAVLLGGAGAPPGLVAEAVQRGWPVLSTYGLTEACSQVATQRYATPPAVRASGAYPVAGMEVRVREGLVEIRGSSLMSSYLPTPATSPIDAEGWFATGDVGRIDDDGRLHILGRRDDVIVSGGENVHPRRVEEALEEHPAIAAAGVVGVTDAEWGEAVAAAIITRSALENEELSDFLATRLAGYERPRHLRHVDELPWVAPGKLDRRRLRKLFESSA